LQPLSFRAVRGDLLLASTSSNALCTVGKVVFVSLTDNTSLDNELINLGIVVGVTWLPFISKTLSFGASITSSGLVNFGQFSTMKVSSSGKGNLFKFGDNDFAVTWSNDAP
jgi:hypothetical protein